MPRTDLTGRIFSKLTVTGFSHVDSRRQAHWHCSCSCEQHLVVAGNNLTSGNTKSCGCQHGIRIDRPITHEQLLRLVTYDPDTGLFHRNVDSRSYKKGALAGYYNKANGYIRVIFRKDQYYAHVLAWFYMTGKWPIDEIDHKDLDGTNNRWHNLRPATPSQNRYNTRGRGAASGYKGVIKVGGAFQARMVFEGRYLDLGQFSTAEEAARAYDVACRQKHGDFARPNFGVDA